MFGVKLEQKIRRKQWCVCKLGAGGIDINICMQTVHLRYVDSISLQQNLKTWNKHLLQRGVLWNDIWCCVGEYTPQTSIPDRGTIYTRDITFHSRYTEFEFDTENFFCDGITLYKLTSYYRHMDIKREIQRRLNSGFDFYLCNAILELGILLQCENTNYAHGEFKS